MRLDWWESSCHCHYMKRCWSKSLCTKEHQILYLVTGRFGIENHFVCIYQVVNACLVGVTRAIAACKSTSSKPVEPGNGPLWLQWSIYGHTGPRTWRWEYTMAGNLNRLIAGTFLPTYLTYNLQRRYSLTHMIEVLGFFLWNDLWNWDPIILALNVPYYSFTC